MAHYEDLHSALKNRLRCREEFGTHGKFKGSVLVYRGEKYWDIQCIAYAVIIEEKARNVANLLLFDGLKVSYELMN